MIAFLHDCLRLFARPVCYLIVQKPSGPSLHINLAPWRAFYRRRIHRRTNHYLRWDGGYGKVV